MRPWAIRIAWIATMLAPFVSHAAIVTGRFHVVAACLAACQVVVLGTMSLRRGNRLIRILGLAVTGMLAVLLVVRLTEPAGLAAPELLASSGVSHLMIYASLLAIFANSLQPGQTPLVTTFARRLRGPLTPDITAYTRGVTKAWCLFFTGQIALSAALFLFAPHSVWSLFVNVLDAPMVLLMFIGEYAVRRVLLRHRPHGSPLSLLRRVVAGDATLPEKP
jgi:uncharacterized membrane protein